MKIKLASSLGAAVALAFVQNAVAADLPARPVYKAPAVAPVVAPWTGFYVGGNFGYGWSRDRDVIVDETLDGAPFIDGTWPGFGRFGNLEMNGIFGGGQAGYNWQTGSWVLGIEADIQGADIDGSATATLPYIDALDTITVTTTGKLDWFGTVRARLGFAWDRALFYATGGVAFGEVKYRQVMTDTFLFDAVGSGKSDSVGWTVGGGIEYLFAPNWSVKAEYQFLDFGTKRFTFPEIGPDPGFAISTDLRSEFHTARVGLNYHFH
jgi:outer membrane immunogenic protein